MGEPSLYTLSITFYEDTSSTQRGKEVRLQQQQGRGSSVNDNDNDVGNMLLSHSLITPFGIRQITKITNNETKVRP